MVTSSKTTRPRNPLYLDNAATSFPKPECVAVAMKKALATCGNPGRSGHSMSIQAARVLFFLRQTAAGCFKVEDPARIIVTPGCTAALNLVLHSLPFNAHVVTTALEHNSVARPLTALQRLLKLSYTRVSPGQDGRVSAHGMASACGPETRLVVVNHVSNVTGAIQDVQAIRRAVPRHIPMLVDAAQSAGCLPIDVKEMDLDYVAIPGHKGLLGPMGTGLLLLGPEAPVPRPLWSGGTGSASESDMMPEFLPDVLEAGTPNIPGAAGLLAALQHLTAKGLEQVLADERRFVAEILHGLRTMPHVQLVGPGQPQHRTATFSIRLQGIDCGEVASRLEREFGILTRSGLHCAPWAHEAMGTSPSGTLRFSWGPTTPPDAAQRMLDALSRLGRE